MKILEELSPEFLKFKLEFISDFNWIVIDNNLSRESIMFLLENLSTQTIIMDAVSAHKARKLKNYLPQISILKLNQMELNELSGFVSSKKQLEDLHERGAKTLLLTNQESESYVSKEDCLISQKPPSTDSIINVTGAGDAFLSGYLHGLLCDKSEEDRLKMANFAARVTLASKESTSSELCSEILEKAIK